MAEKNDISTEQAIMDAAEELFLENGYDRTSTTAIARKAGCNQALVHYYYRSKENLFGLVFRKKVAGFLSFLEQLTQEDLPFEERLKKRIAAHFDMIRTNERMPVIFFMEIATNKDLAKMLLESFKDLPLPVIQHIQMELDAEFQAGRIRQTQATDLVFSIFAMNIMAFLLKPVIQLYTDASPEVMEKMLQERKESNIQTILFSLKPN
jgi:TetR/AcrR family transcriptional regulator